MLFLSQLAGCGLALLAPWVRRVPVVGRGAAALRYFLVLNAALLLGFAQFARGAAGPSWSRTPRQANADGSPMRRGGAPAGTQAAPPAFSGGSSSQLTGSEPTIVADIRSNSVIIVTDRNTYRTLESIIRRLDQRRQWQ